MEHDKQKLDPEQEKFFLDKTVDSLNDVLIKLKCPLSKKIFKYPVLASDSNVYEMIEIVKRIKDDNKSPITGEVLKPNIILVKSLKSFINSLLEYFPQLKEHIYIYDKNNTYNFCENQDFFNIIFNGDIWKFIFYFYNFDLQILGKEFIINLLKSNNYLIIKHIIDNTKNLNSNIEELSLMHYVIQYSNDTIFNYLITKEFNIFSGGFKGKNSYLYYASYYSTPNVTKFFLEKDFYIFEYCQNSYACIIKGITSKQDYYTNLLLLNKIKKNLKTFYEYELDRSIGYFKENITYNKKILKEQKSILLKEWDIFKKN